jgi:hypothetical protein
VIPPNLARLLRHAAIGWQAFLRDGHYKSIDVLHVNSPPVLSSIAAVLHSRIF